MKSELQTHDLRRQAPASRVNPAGSLYDPRFEHDACGVGFVADVQGRASHAVLETGLQALIHLSHRGAVDADGKTGDGAGVLTQIPHKLLLAEAGRLGGGALSTGELGVGMFFLPREDAGLAARCRAAAESIVHGLGMRVIGWRTVPVDPQALGAKAAETAPRIEQLLIARHRIDPGAFERTLYLARKRIETSLSDIESFYIPSLSSRTLVYKGLFVASQLQPFYQDLGHPDYETALAVIHQRYSTNTFPNWFLAQPFHMLAHNGEINTLSGNQIWMKAREPELVSAIWGEQVEDLKPVIWADGSDSASLDNVLELLTQSGRDPLHAMMLMMPEAYERSIEVHASVRGFYDYAACLMEPWDGPAAVAFSDGRFVGAALDRNGLRPARWTLTRDDLLIMASEAGAIELPADRVREHGRLGPGMMLAVDTERGRLMRDESIKSEQAERRTYRQWVLRSLLCQTPLDIGSQESSEAAPVGARMQAFGYTEEDVRKILAPMFAEGKEPVGSMGDDTPLAALSTKPRMLYTYFKQRFAQVTNPAIDPLRERLVMSLTSILGARRSLLEESESHARLIRLNSPILDDNELVWLLDRGQEGFPSIRLSTLFDPAGGEAGMEAALDRLVEEAAGAVRNGCSILVMSDRGVSASRAPMPMLLAVAAVHQSLIAAGLRMKVSLVAETAETREEHHFACLIGNGASAVNPYLALEVVTGEVGSRGMSILAAQRNFKTAVETGLLKIMAKMGITTVASYCGARTFETIGLAEGFVDRYFTGTPARAGGVGLFEIARDTLCFHNTAFGPDAQPRLEDVGYFRFRRGGEYHTFNPDVFRSLHKLARTNQAEAYDAYRDHVDNRPPALLRDLLEFCPMTPVPLDEVEPVEAILSRMSTSGMSHGALSREAHEAIAIAMNRLGGKSNSGEGGEDIRRFHPYSNGDWAISRIKQVASARFGVTTGYLVSADEIEIKISQGSKPGEGGQLPGHKVSEEIASIRHSVPGVTLISPPPHHDIYSIEDIAQLIYDLKQVNTGARVAVKLVSEAGVGTVAAGVAKAFADVVHISGHDGGTGASPLGSIKNAGTPWELGLAEAQQVLVLNNLRGRVRLRVDGGMKTGRDVVIAALLGAEEFGFATAVVVALGCVMARQCHLNTCPVGIATQEVGLRKKFPGKPEMVVTFFRSMAEDIRRILAGLGARSIDEIVGRTDLLAERKETRAPKGVKLDLRAVLARVDPDRERPSRSIPGLHRELPASLTDRIFQDVADAVASGTPVSLSYPIRNTHRTVGARLAGEIARRYGDEELPDGTFDLTFRGAAGQSFGAFNVSGMRLTLFGEANDYVGKGMSGGEIIVRPPFEARLEGSDNVIMGNTVMYGATGGVLYAAGRAGERFCVRNSGGCAVVEGLGYHGCEYMTAGVVVVLGEVGRNFGAGMTGGLAYVLDERRNFHRRYNSELVKLESVIEESDLELLRQFIRRHYELTRSARACEILWYWDDYQPLFWKVVTTGASAVGPRVSSMLAMQPGARMSGKSGDPIPI
ncbi:MAG: glutamate synthase large subunit [Acidobacteria bacterium]|nr:glutamate synthase large subunit [Acidobacteriota bacterium]